MIKKYVEKSLKNTANATEVSIVKEDNSFYILNDGVRILKEVFQNKFEEVNDNATSDVERFFNRSNTITESLAKQVLSIDPTKVRDSQNVDRQITGDFDRVDRSKRDGFQQDINYDNDVIKSTPNDEIRHVDKPALKPQVIPDVSQYKVYDNEDDIDVDQFLGKKEPDVTKTKEVSNVHVENTPEPTKKETKIVYVPTETVKETNQESIFKMFKMSHDIVINLSFNTKIAKPDFIKMMLENLDGDIVEYYTQNILKDILSDTSKVKLDIYNQIKNEIDKPEKIKKEKVIKPLVEGSQKSQVKTPKNTDKPKSPKPGSKNNDKK